ncbi:Fpg/Nei family DNA glycosylase [Coraliomargarita sp. W4R53]
MPELPEVKTIQDQLNAIMPFEIRNCTLSQVASSIVHTPMDRLRGCTFLEVRRKGKMLDFVLNDGRHLLSQLGMSGGWLIAPQEITEKHTHVQFTGASHFLGYVDPRRFGHMYLYDEAQAATKLAELGHDLLSPEFTVRYFKAALLRYPERAVKVSLLDQSLFAGTGNYIANEICAHARVLPHRQVKTLSAADLGKLYRAVSTVIDGTITRGGVAFGGGYRDTKGDKGTGVQNLVVFYQQQCQLCKKTPVMKTILGQRGTYHCPRCQK